MSREILVKIQDHVATVTLNRPNKRNAINYHMWNSLGNIFTDLDMEQKVRVIVLTGAGEEAFSAGADISEFDKYRSTSIKAKEYAEAFDSTANALDRISKPTISMIKGYCVGGGCELSLATNCRIAASNSHFGIPAARLGIVIGYREMQRLVNLVGSGNAEYMLLSAQLLDPHEALRIGLINQVLPLEELEEFTYTLANNIAEHSPLSYQIHKKILKTIVENPSLNNLTQEEKHIPFSMFDTEDFQEGAKAFMEKRNPRFRNR